MSTIAIMFIAAAIIFIIGAIIYISISFLFEEKAMTVKIYLKYIIKNEVELKHLADKIEDKELKIAMKEELKQIHEHAMYIKHVLTDTK